jgi:CheY-like chemotaxis protein
MNVFLSYQRADSAFAAHALWYALQRASHEAFVDTGDIGLGHSFREAISNAISKSNVLLALVGAGFAVARLGDPMNVVAYEWQTARFHGVPVVPVLVDGATLPANDLLPPVLRWFGRRNALTLRRSSLMADIDACVAAVPALAITPRSSKRVLWVDDRPANNEAERRQLRPYGIVFDCVVSTTEAVEQLKCESYDLVITDLGRTESADRSDSAGEALLALEFLRSSGPPVIVYGGRSVITRSDELMQLGAICATADSSQLHAAVLASLGRDDM